MITLIMMGIANQVGGSISELTPEQREQLLKEFNNRWDDIILMSVVLMEALAWVAMGFGCAYLVMIAFGLLG